MKKILLILSVMCLIPFFAQAQKTLQNVDPLDPPMINSSFSLSGKGALVRGSGSECRPVSQFSATVDYDDVTLNWAPPTSNEIRYYNGDPESEIGTLDDSPIWMAMRIPSSVLSEYPSTATYPFSLTNVKFIPAVANSDVTYEINVYTADPNGPSHGDFSANLIGTYTVTGTVANEFNICNTDIDIDKTQDLIIAVKIVGTNLSTLRYTTTGAVSGFSNLISTDGVNFNYVYENTNSLPISWYISAIVDYPNANGQKNIIDNIQPINNMKLYQPNALATVDSKSIPDVNTVSQYILYRDGDEIATVNSDVLSYVDKNLPHVTHTYIYSIVVKHDNDGDICLSRPTNANVSVSFCNDADHLVSGVYAFVNVEERSITAYWSAPANPDVVDYSVFCYNIDLNECINVATTSLQEYTLSGMQTGNYKFCIVANYASCLSGEVCTDVLNLPEECGYPVQSLAIAQDTVEVKAAVLSWVKPVTSHNINGYTINKYQYVNDVLTFVATYSTSGTSYFDSEVNFYDTYQYQIVVNYFNGCYSIPTSAEVTIHKDPVTDLNASQNGNEVTLTWNAPVQKGVTGYNIYVNNVLTATVTTPIYINAFNDGTYTFSVAAVYANQYESALTSINVILANTYTITANANPSEGGFVTGSGTYNEGVTATVTATATANYAFINWTENGTVVSTDATYSFIVLANRNLVANFAAHNIISIADDYMGHANQPVQIGVNLSNPIDEVVGYQFDIVLPENVTLVPGSIALTDRASSNHNIAYSFIPSGAVRILAYSMPGTPFAGTNGNVCTFQVIGSQDGIYPLEIENTVLSDADGNELYVTTSNGNLTIEDVAIIATANPVEGGTIEGAGTYFIGDQATLTATSNEGYTFQNWTENGTVVSIDAVYSFTVETNRALVANFTINSYEVKVAANPVEGGSVLGNATYNYNETALVEAINNENYVFVNWTENGAVVSTDATYSFAVTANRNLVANFVPNNVLSIAEGYMGHANIPVDMTINLSNPINEVVGYQVDVVLPANVSLVPGSIKLTDRASVNHNLAYSFIPGGALRILVYSMPGTPFTGIDGDVCLFQVIGTQDGVYPIVLANPVLSDVDGNELYVTATNGSLIIGDVVITATANPVEGGTISGAGVYYPGDAVNLTATPNINYAFINWTENGTIVSTNPVYTFAAETNRTLVANFAAQNILSIGDYVAHANETVQVGINLSNPIDEVVGYQIDVILPANVSIVPGSIALTDRASANHNLAYSFIPSGALRILVYSMPGTPFTGIDGNVCTFQVTGSQYGIYPLVLANPVLSDVDGNELYVRTEDGTLSVGDINIAASANPYEGGTITGAGMYFSGDQVTLTATENAGYTFNNWTENGTVVSTDAAYSFIAEINRILVANFTINSYEVTVAADPIEGGSVIGNGIYNYGKTATVTATANTNYAFINWIENGTVVSTDASYSFTVTTSHNLVANFAAQNILSIAEGYMGHANQPIQIGINLSNPIDEVVGYQVDVILPTNVSLVPGSIALTDRASTNHNLAYSFIPGGALRILVYSMPGTPFTGIDGNICTFEVTGSKYGIYPLILGNPVLSDIDGNELYVTTSNGTVAIGDINIAAYANPVTGGTITGAGMYSFDDQVTLTAAANNGYTFENWTENGIVVSTDATYSFIAQVNRILIANFTTNSYEVAVVANPAEGGSVTGNGTYYFGETATVTATPNTNYIFQNWTENGTVVSTNTTYSFTVAANRNLVANFAGYNILSIAHTYIGTVNQPVEIGINLSNPVDGVVGYQVDLILPENISLVPGSVALTDRASTNHIIAYNFIPSGALRILVYSMPGTPFTGIDGNVCTFQIVGSQVGVYQLGLENPVISDINGNELYVEARNGHIAITSGGSNTVNITAVPNPYEGGTASGTGIYNINDQVTLTATANTGYTFQNWTEDGTVVSNDVVYTFTAVTSRILVANFTINTYEVTVAANPTNGGSVTGNDTYDYGETATVTATPNTNYVFVNWTENGIAVSTDPAYSFAVTANRNLVANFVVSNVLSISDYTSQVNEPVQIGINLSNPIDEVVGYQVDVVLPANVSLVAGSVALTDRASANHIIVSNFIPSGALRILVYSMPGTPFTGTDGNICTFQVIGSQTGVYPLGLENAVLSDIGGNELNVSTENGSLTVNNGANTVNIVAVASPYDGGTVTGADVYNIGDQVTLTATANTGYTFQNWTEDGIVVSTDAVYTFTAETNRVLVANFQINSVTITATANPTDGGVVSGNGVYNVGSTVTLQAYNLYGYSFTSWTEDGTVVSENSTYSFTASTDRVLVANFTINSYTVNFVADPTDGGVTTGSGTYQYGDIAHLVATANPGYQFVNITTDDGTIISNGDENWFIIFENCNFVAHFTVETYTVSAFASPTNGGTITGVNNPYSYSQTATLTAISNSDYTFTNWTSNGQILSTDPTYSFEVTSNCVIVAHFDYNNPSAGIVITATVNPENYGVTTGSGTYQLGDNVVMSAYPFNGYNFNNWTENGTVVSQNASFSFVATVNRTFVANFSVAAYTVTGIANPAIGGTVNGSGSYQFGDFAILTSVPAAGYECVNWTDESGNVVALGDTYGFIVTDNRTITANFVQETYTVDAFAYPINTGTITGTGEFYYQQTAVLTATPNYGYKFVNWKDLNGSVISTDPVLSVVVTSDVTYIATFAVNGSQMYPSVMNLTAQHENLTAELTWNAPENATPIAYVCTAYDGNTIVYSLNTDQTTAIMKFLAEKTYRIKVSAVYEDGGISDGVSTNVTIAVNQLANFIISNTELNHVSLTWDPCPSDRYHDFYKYQITRNNDVIEIFDINDTTYIDNLKNAGDYQYCVSICYGPNGIVETEPICHSITMVYNDMFPPVSLNTPNPVNLSANLTWTVPFPSVVNNYKVYVDNVLVSTPTEMSQLCKVSSEGLHTATVYAVYDDNISVGSSKDFVIDVNEVSSLAVAQNANHVNITWVAPVDTYYDFDHYTIKRNGDEIATIYNMNETSYSDMITEGYSIYDYCVVATYGYHGTTTNYVASQPVCKSISVAEIFPPVPYILVDNQNLSYVAKWPSMANAKSYEVYVDGVYQGTQVDTVFASKSNDIGKKTIGVIVKYEDGNSIITNVDFTLSLNAPDNLAATVDGNNVNLTWTAPADKYSDLSGYVLLRNGKPIINLGSNATSYTDVPPYGTYEYCIKAQYNTPAGEALYSVADCISGVSTTCPSVTDLNGSFDYNNGKVVLTWSAPTSDGTYTYNVYRNNVKIATVSEPTYTDNTIDNYNEYSYNVSVICSDGNESSLSNTFSGSYACGSFPVKNLTAKFDNANGPIVTLTWDKPLSFINGQTYNIYRQGVLIAEKYTGNVYYDHTNMPSGTYTYTVTEVCEDGHESENSNVSVGVETGIGENESINVTVYPNPTAGDVNVSCENISKVVVYNSLGQVVKMIDINDVVDNVVITTAELHSGVYIFNITNRDGVSAQKRVIVSK